MARVRLLVLLALAGLYLAGLATDVTGDGLLHVLLRDWFKVAVYLGAAALTWRAGGPWRLMAAGMALYGCASAIDMARGPALEDTDAPALALLCWLAFYLAAYVTVFQLVRRQAGGLPRSTWLDGIVAALALGALTAATAWVPVTDDDSGLKVVVGLAYPLFDVLLLGALLFLVGLTGLRPGRQALVLLSAFALNFVADTALVVRAAGGAYERGTVLDAAFPLVFVLLVVASQRAADGAPARASGKRMLVLPAASVLVAFAVHGVGLATELPVGAEVLALAALVLGAVRCGWGFLEVRRVYESRRFEQGFDEAAIGMALLTPDGRWSRVNGALAALLGRPAAALHGRPVSDVIDDVEDGAISFRRTDGTIVETEVTTADVEEPDGQRWTFVQVVDVTDRRRAARFGEALTQLGELALETRDADRVTAEAVRVVRRALGAEATTVRFARREGIVAHDGPPFELGPDVQAAGIRHGAGARLLAARGGARGADATRFLQAVANLLASALDQAGAEHELRRAALEDPLTGLANRAMLTAQLERDLARSRRGAGLVGVLLLDLDRFKLVNDTLGHGAGDAVLRVVAERLGREVRGTDLVGRLGGDEFVVLVTATREDDVLALADRLVAALARPVQLDGRELPLGASIGVAVATDGRASAEELLRDADVAMYRAKDGGGGRHELFDGRLRRGLVERLALEEALSGAVARDELQLGFQPVVDLETGAVHGFEALLRWEHPGRGLLGPSTFVGVAEETGQIVPLGRWALHHACATAATWPAPDGGGHAPWVSVNLSPRQVTQDLVGDVRAALDAAGLEACRLRLEVTESLALETAGTSEVLRDLRALGVRLALDDFGTGWSSLSLLQALPFDVLKLDRSFVARLDDAASAAVLRAAVDLGASLDLTVVAEGVEHAEQRDRLLALGCPLGQGWLFAPAVSADAVAALLEPGVYPAWDGATATA